MKKTCILLGGPVAHDARVLKITQTISQLDSDSVVDLFCLDEGAVPTLPSNVKLHPLRIPSPRRAKWLRHTLFTREFDFFVPAVLKIAAQNGAPYDVIYANDLPMLRPALALKSAMKSRLIYDSHEIYIETLNQFLPTQAKFPRQMVFNALLRFMQSTGERAERAMVRQTDAFLTVNPSIARYFEEKYGVQPVEVVMNCPPRQKVAPVPAVDFRALYGWDSGDTILIYQGVLNKGRGLELLLRALEKTGENVRLVIVGEGTLRAPLEGLAQSLGIASKVQFFGRVPQEKLLAHTAGADIGVNLVEDFNLSKKMSSPNKLFEYMHAGLPVLCSDSLENRRVFEKYEIGILTQNNADEIAASLVALVESNKKPMWRENALRGALEYCWENQSQVLSEVFERLSPS